MEDHIALPDDVAPAAVDMAVFHGGTEVLDAVVDAGFVSCAHQHVLQDELVLIEAVDAVNGRRQPEADFLVHVTELSNSQRLLRYRYPSQSLSVIAVRWPVPCRRGTRGDTQDSSRRGTGR